MGALHRLLDAFLVRPHLPIVIYLAVVGGEALFHGASGPLLPYWLSVMWTASLMVGGALAFFGAITLKTRLESSGTALLAYGAGVYGCVFMTRTHDWHTLLVSVAVVGMCLIRMRVLAKARRGQELAARIRDQDRR